MTRRIPSPEVPVITIPSSSYRTQRLTFSLLFTGLIFALGLAFGLHAMMVGHDHVFGTSREVPWGILITPYVFFACLATGACIVSSLGQVFRVTPFIPLVKRSVYISIIAMASGLFAIGMEVENPWRVVVYGILSANPLSNIWWKSAIYSLFLLLMIGNYYLILTGREKHARGFGLAALIAITCGNLNMSSDMALIGARSFWAENYMPLFFLTVSSLSAISAIVVLNRFSDWLSEKRSNNELALTMMAMRKLSIVLLIGLLFFVTMKVLGGFSAQFTENPDAMRLLVKGDFAINFWVGEVALSLFVPLLLLSFYNGGRQQKFFVLAAIGVLIGLFITFYDLIIIGQLIPHFYDYNLYGDPQFYSYSPSLHEYMMMAGTVAFFFMAFLIGELLFKNSHS